MYKVKNNIASTYVLDQPRSQGFFLFVSEQKFPHFRHSKIEGREKDLFFTEAPVFVRPKCGKLSIYKEGLAAQAGSIKERKKCSCHCN